MPTLPPDAAALENARRAVQQLLLPGVNLVRMNPVRARQLGDRPVALDRCQRHLRFERRAVLLACLLHVLLPRHQRCLGAGLHLNQLSRFRGPPHTAGRGGARSSLSAAPRAPRGRHPSEMALANGFFTPPGEAVI
jgi:hypothetical protein